jgi:hypothetical protein
MWKILMDNGLGESFPSCSRLERPEPVRPPHGRHVRLRTLCHTLASCSCILHSHSALILAFCIGIETLSVVLL